MKRMLSYKGYHAKIEFDADDMIFVGEVFGIQDSLNFHGTSIVELEEMFHQSIDNYLEMCAFLGKSPDKEYKGSFNVRINPDLHRKASEKAQQMGITLNQYVETAIIEAVRPTNNNVVYYLPALNMRIPAYVEHIDGNAKKRGDYLSTEKKYYERVSK